MSKSTYRLITLIIGLAILAVTVAHPLPLVRAQDGDGLLAFNEPTVVTLSPGGILARSFNALPGDSFELRLSRLAEYTYNAVLVDPAGAAQPLPMGADGNAVLAVATAAGGTYLLVVQSGEGAGEMLLQLNGTQAEPVVLQPGQTPVDLIDTAQRYSVDPPPGAGPSQLIVEIPTPTDPAAPPNFVPAFVVLDAETGELLLAVEAGQLPYVSLTLPPNRSYLLGFAPGEAPLQALVTWLLDGVPGAAPTAGPVVPVVPGGGTGSGPCSLLISGNVNVRSGPGTNNDVIGTVGAGTTLPVIAQNTAGDWYQVNLNGQLGWVYTLLASVTRQGNCTTLPVVSAESGTPSGTITGTVTPTITPGGPTLTPTTTYTPSYTPSVTYTPSPTYTPGGPTVTPTYTDMPTDTPTWTATWTPTTPPPTATWTATWTPTVEPEADQEAPVQEEQAIIQPTFTYTPSYTPTTPPPPPTAPPDGNYTLNIPLDSTTSVTDFVSYPDGDTQDRVSWNITGMNPNSGLSGGQARLILAVSCFGTGTQNVTFFTGGQTYSCGQTIVDREVTNDSRTGSVLITAVSGTNTYVQWVVTGTASRIN
ncbi:MAG: SH3 domain-containing protein [Chloroflexi bacterium]|nr:SH3 domain-containing protein [Chloroflexota bacterium]